MLTATGTIKATTTVAASAGMLGLGVWAWVFAIIGAFFSVYLEEAKEPKEALKTILSILAYAFASAMLAVVAPHIAWFGIGDMAGKIPVEARAGILGLSIRWGVSNVIKPRAKNWGNAK
jgi:amino acid permease